MPLLAVASGGKCDRAVAAAFHDCTPFSPTHVPSLNPHLPHPHTHTPPPLSCSLPHPCQPHLCAPGRRRHEPLQPRVGPAALIRALMSAPPRVSPWLPPSPRRGVSKGYGNKRQRQHLRDGSASRPLGLHPAAPSRGLAAPLPRDPAQHSPDATSPLTRRAPPDPPPHPNPHTAAPACIRRAAPPRGAAPPNSLPAFHCPPSIQRFNAANPSRAPRQSCLFNAASNRPAPPLRELHPPAFTPPNPVRRRNSHAPPCTPWSPT